MKLYKTETAIWIVLKLFSVFHSSFSICTVTLVCFYAVNSFIIIGVSFMCNQLSLVRAVMKKGISLQKQLISKKSSKTFYLPGHNLSWYVVQDTYINKLPCIVHVTWQILCNVERGLYSCVCKKKYHAFMPTHMSYMDLARAYTQVCACQNWLAHV